MKQTCTLVGGPLISQQDSNLVTSSHNKLGPGGLLSHSSFLSYALYLANLTHNDRIKKSPKCLLDLVCTHLGRQGWVEG